MPPEVPNIKIKLKSGNWILVSEQDLTERQMTDDGKRMIVHLWAKELHHGEPDKPGQPSHGPF